MIERIWKIDEDISKGVFNLRLPAVVEWVLSVPGNMFGLVPSIMVGPLWVMILLDEESPPWGLSIVASLLSVGFLVAWMEFNRGNKLMLKNVLASRALYALAPSLSTGICYWQASDPLVLALSFYSSVLWLLSIVVTMQLKDVAQRERPCAKFQRLHERKHLNAIIKTLSKVGGKASFPSGDATGVVAFALPISTKYPTVAALFVVTTCFARMYFLAHHMLDTVAGCAIAYSIHLLLTQVAGTGMEFTTVWHPLMAQAFFIAMLLLTGLRHR